MPVSSPVPVSMNGCVGVCVYIFKRPELQQKEECAFLPISLKEVHCGFKQVWLSLVASCSNLLE